MSEHEEADEGRVRVTDRRRIDPDTGEVRPNAPEAQGSPSNAGSAGSTGNQGNAGAPADQQVEADLVGVEAKVAELTGDLQRVHAEYANYRKRVERDRELIRELAVGSTLAELLPVLDDVERAREHGELEGAFRSVGESLESTAYRIGLERFGEVGEGFDPTLHEALATEARDDITEPTVVAVYQPGYRFAGRVLRPARVAVAGTD